MFVLQDLRARWHNFRKALEFPGLAELARRVGNIEGGFKERDKRLREMSTDIKTVERGIEDIKQLMTSFNINCTMKSTEIKKSVDKNTANIESLQAEKAEKELSKRTKWTIYGGILTAIILSALNGLIELLKMLHPA